MYTAEADILLCYLVPNRFGEIGNENGTHAIGIKMACSDLNAAGKKLLKGHLRHVEFHNKVGEGLIYHRCVYYNRFDLEFMFIFYFRDRKKTRCGSRDKENYCQKSQTDRQKRLI